jgi:hypothetical protein
MGLMILWEKQSLKVLMNLRKLNGMKRDEI